MKFDVLYKSMDLIDVLNIKEIGIKKLLKRFVNSDVIVDVVLTRGQI